MSNNVRFGSVSEMLRATSEDHELVEDVERRISERQLVKHLIAHRVKNDMSQQDVAEKFGCTQSRISKLEGSKDDDIRLGDLQAYIQAIGMRLRLVISPESQTAIDEVKYHAYRIKDLLSRLAALAEKDDKIADGVTNFVCIEAPVNLLKMVSDAAKLIPHDVLERLPFVVMEDECLACEQEAEESRQQLRSS